MKYKGVTRTVTIHIQRSSKKGPYTIDMVPEHLEAMPGDTVAWNVQGAPAGVDVTVGNFVRTLGAPRVRVKSGTAHVIGSAFPAEKITKTPAGHWFKVKLNRLQPGIFKYDVKFGAVTVMDPEIEIPRPGR